ncbi:TetR/AcrR family transcriptional regulator [Streptomyces sp. CSDS2]|uniref:TetR/AcrR family transcriptional regulator n=1 Tax=Streptomyces sp. CSDS2 TaxID=3055051 RepID=UPI0025B0A0F4|nr:TetR/AcrR family transcriptional regulator [Streptomyces sp. CSDS2]MDN3260911.1 TetR/AcrR family transcriptional regulator [Streptomyces sp. CSDS2]
MASAPHQRSAPTGRRERNKQRMAGRLYDAALTLFQQKGYDETTIDEITELADTARGTFFNHFPQKEDLIAAWSEQRRQLLTDLVADLDPEQPTLTRLSLCLAHLARMNESEAAVARVMVSAWVKAGRPLSEEPGTAATFAEIIRHGMERGDVRPGTDPNLLGLVLRDAYLGALYRWAQGAGKTGSLNTELQSILRLLAPCIDGTREHAPADAA